MDEPFEQTGCLPCMCRKGLENLRVPILLCLLRSSCQMQLLVMQRNQSFCLAKVVVLCGRVGCPRRVPNLRLLFEVPESNGS
jgi:hypothetical protein